MVLIAQVLVKTCFFIYSGDLIAFQWFPFLCTKNELTAFNTIFFFVFRSVTLIRDVKMSLNLAFYEGSQKPSLAPSLLVGIGICILGVFWWVSCRRLPLPPGPKGRFPFMGMTFDMPKTSPWVAITEWAK